MAPAIRRASDSSAEGPARELGTTWRQSTGRELRSESAEHLSDYRSPPAGCSAGDPASLSERTQARRPRAAPPLGSCRWQRAACSLASFVAGSGSGCFRARPRLGVLARGRARRGTRRGPSLSSHALPGPHWQAAIGTSMRREQGGLPNINRQSDGHGACSPPSKLGDAPQAGLQVDLE